jgi:hypothetical protein
MKQRKTKLAKASSARFAETPPIPVLSKTLGRLRLPPGKAAARPKPRKQGGKYSQSRGPRKLKTLRNAKLLFRFCALL